MTPIIKLYFIVVFLRKKLVSAVNVGSNGTLRQKFQLFESNDKLYSKNDSEQCLQVIIVKEFDKQC